jgi:dihydroorotate dehydrogenase
MGLVLDNPLIVASSGLTGSPEGVEKAAAAGAGAVVLK